MSSIRSEPLNVGDKLRRYKRIDVALHLVCDVTFDATQRYMKLQHEDQLRLGLWLLFSMLLSLITVLYYIFLELVASTFPAARLQAQAAEELNDWKTV